MTETGFRTADTEVTTYKLYVNIVTTEKPCFRRDFTRQVKPNLDIGSRRGK
jgi:3-deoxy-D-manno-octulosonic-acid transferase